MAVPKSAIMKEKKKECVNVSVLYDKLPAILPDPDTVRGRNAITRYVVIE